MKSKGKNTYLTILIIITAICVVVGIVINTTQVFVGNNYKTKSGTVSVETSTPVESIKFDISLANVIIKTGDEFEIEYKNILENIVPTVTENNGEVVIKQKRDKKNKSISGLNFSKGKSGEIIVYIPKDLSEVDINADLAMGSFEIYDITCDDMDLDLSMGSVELHDVSADYARVDLSMGSLDFDNCNVNDIDADLSMGSADLNGKFNKIKADADMGSIDIKNDNEDCDYNIDCSMGSIVVNGDKKGKTYNN